MLVRNKKTLSTRIIFFAVDSNASDEENLEPSNSKTLIQVEGQEEGDEGTKIYKQRLRNVSEFLLVHNSLQVYYFSNQEKSITMTNQSSSRH